MIQQKRSWITLRVAKGIGERQPLTAFTRIWVENVSRGDVIWVFRKLDSFGCGSFKVGRKGHQSRFEWDVKMVEVGQAAAGETEQVEEVSPEEAGEENGGNSLFKHTFRLRPDQSVTVELPADLTSQEAARMARFIETLPFQDDTIDRAS